MLTIDSLQWLFIHSILTDGISEMYAHNIVMHRRIGHSTGSMTNDRYMEHMAVPFSCT